MLPPIGKLDTASVVAVLLVAIVDVACIFALHGVGLPPPLLLGASGAQRDRAHAVVDVPLRHLSLCAAEPDRSRVAIPRCNRCSRTLCEPVLRPFRRLIPAVAGLDLSPLWAIIAIQAILILP